MEEVSIFASKKLKPVSDRMRSGPAVQGNPWLREAGTMPMIPVHKVVEAVSLKRSRIRAT